MLIANTGFWQAFDQATLTTPVTELMLLLLVISFCLLSKWTRVGLLLSFAYVYRWGWLCLHKDFGDQTPLLVTYYIAGLLIIVASAVSFLMSRE